MGSYEENYLAKRPQHLCHMCGKCCRMSTTSTPYEELKKLAAEGHQGAIDFLSIFVPYKSIEEARKVEPEVVENIIKHQKEDGKYNEANLTFYGCKYLGKDNLCTRYESRLDLCKHCPSTPWSIVPPGCGFEGWLFWQREEIKKIVIDDAEFQVCTNQSLRRRYAENFLRTHKEYRELFSPDICRLLYESSALSYFDEIWREYKNNKSNRR